MYKPGLILKRSRAYFAYLEKVVAHLIVNLWVIDFLIQYCLVLFYTLHYDL
jgi:hypothetical protein